MRHTLTIARSFLGIVFFILISLVVKSQVTVPSTNGYSVTINVQPVSIVVTSNGCPWGYNYNVNLTYAISFNGVNPPASLYTLQGFLGCGNGNSHFFQLPLSGGNGTVTSQSTQWVNNCTDNTLSSLNCNTIQIIIEGPGIPNQTTSYPVTPILPVIMGNFSASHIAEKQVQLQWEILSDDTDASYIIERSADGLKWSKLGTTQATGNSSGHHTYTYNDVAPLEGVSYYRIRQTDQNGRTVLSRIISTSTISEHPDLSLYPVPNLRNIVTVKGLTTINDWSFVLLTIHGVEKYRTTMSSADIQLPYLQSGVYIVRLTNQKSGKTVLLRYIKS